MTRTSIIRKLSVLAAALALLNGCRSTPQQKEAKFMKRGLERLAAKDYGRAMLEFQSAAREMPNDAEPYYQLGLASIEAKDGRNALIALAKANQLNPNHVQAQVKLAELLSGSGRQNLIQTAKDKLKEVANTSPDN